MSIGGFTINRNPMAAVYEIIRQKNRRLPDSKLVELENPFGTWCDTKKIVLVPAINPDVTIIHVQKADFRGNCRIDGLTFADVEQAKAGEVLIITCEELLDDDKDVSTRILSRNNTGGDS